MVFVKTGLLEPLGEAPHREEIRNVFGEPDNEGLVSRNHPTPRLWHYGDVEFYFDRDTWKTERISVELSRSISGPDSEGISSGALEQ